MCPSGKNKSKRTTSQLMNYVPGSYWDRTSRPIYALAFLLGFIILYEIGTILVSPQLLSDSFANSDRRGVVVSFIWIKEALVFLKFSENMAWFTTPLVLVIILLAWQYASKSSWRVSVSDFVPMTIECIIYAIPLLVMGLFISNHPATQSVVAASSTDSESGAYIAQIVTSIGAGIYEELVFRLILISLIVVCLHDVIGISNKWSLVLATFLSAILFSAHHYAYYADGQWKFPEVLTVSSFIFRFLAGGYFAVIFASRGFGIAAGTHAFYDIIVVTMNAMFFAV